MDSFLGKPFIYTLFEMAARASPHILTPFFMAGHKTKQLLGSMSWHDPLLEVHSTKKSICTKTTGKKLP
jgi:hypothetical protein